MICFSSKGALIRRSIFGTSLVKKDTLRYNVVSDRSSLIFKLQQSNSWDQGSSSAHGRPISKYQLVGTPRTPVLIGTNIIIRLLDVTRDAFGSKVYRMLIYIPLGIWHLDAWLLE